MYLLLQPRVDHKYGYMYFPSVDVNILCYFVVHLTYQSPKIFLAVGTITNGGLTYGFHFELSLKISFRENMYNFLSTKRKFQPSSSRLRGSKRPDKPEKYWLLSAKWANFRN